MISAANENVTAGVLQPVAAMNTQECVDKVRLLSSIHRG
jgi:hypothetical protein